MVFTRVYFGFSKLPIFFVCDDMLSDLSGSLRLYGSMAACYKVRSESWNGLLIAIEKSYGSVYMKICMYIQQGGLGISNVILGVQVVSMNFVTKSAGKLFTVCCTP